MQFVYLFYYCIMIEEQTRNMQNNIFLVLIELYILKYNVCLVMVSKFISCKLSFT